VSQNRYRCADLQAPALTGVSKDLVSSANRKAPGQLVRPHPHPVELGDVSFAPRYNTRRKTERRFQALLDDEEVLPSGQGSASEKSKDFSCLVKNLCYLFRTVPQELLCMPKKRVGRVPGTYGIGSFP